MSYKRNLSNRFNGQTSDLNLTFADKNIKAGIANQMTITVVNQNTAYPLPFALIPANFDTLSLTAVTTEDSGTYTTEITKSYNDVTEMNAAGFVVGGVSCDGGNDQKAQTAEGAYSYLCSSADPSRKIKPFLDYIKLNPVRLKNVEVVSSDNNAFDSNMMLTYINPFFKNAQQQIDLSAFYSLYQDATDRIRIDFDGEVELSDLSMLTAVIPANTTMKFIMRFVS